MIDNFKIVAKSGIPFSVNNILGFPHETRELAFDTIRFNKLIDANDRNAYHFTPFHGTPLRDEVERLGFLKDEDIVQSFVIGTSLLNMPQFPRDQIEGLTKTFNMYVKFPENRWDHIRLAEQKNEEGERIYQELREEFVEKYFDNQDEGIEVAAMGN